MIVEESVAAAQSLAHDLEGDRLDVRSVQSAASVIAALESGLDELRVRLPVARVALPSVSRVSESVQIRDSQHENDQDETAILTEPLDPLAGLTKPAETVLDDLDLALLESFASSGWKVSSI